jgi:nitrite reductase/ring-hydroxylating ferredoxin subunit
MTDTTDITEAGTTDREGIDEMFESVLPRRTPGQLTDRVAAALGLAPLTAPDDLGYELVDRPEPPPVPNGWYGIASSSAVGVGESLAVIGVQRELVVFRGADGVAHTLDAHCPHMGAHLGGGEIVGDTIACPYHGWRFEGDGTCVDIPYNESRIPSRACVPSYPTREVSGMILFWFHAGGAAPDYEVPGVDEVDDPAFTDAFVYEGELVASLQEMAENNVDYTHFYFVHRRAALDESTSQFTTDGPFSTVIESFDDDDLVFTRYTYGPGIALLRVTNLMTIFTATTPIDRRHVRLLWHFYLPEAMAPAAADIIDGVTGEFGLGADLPIWRDKVYRERPLLVKGDGPIAEFRRWYSQFYEGRPGYPAPAQP